VSATNLNHWALGPAYYQNLEETNPECFVCSEPINEEAFCQGAEVAFARSTQLKSIMLRIAHGALLTQKREDAKPCNRKGPLFCGMVQLLRELRPTDHQPRGLR
jgi:hypothetical protein